MLVNDNTAEYVFQEKKKLSRNYLRWRYRHKKNVLGWRYIRDGQLILLGGHFEKAAFSARPCLL